MAYFWTAFNWDDYDRKTSHLPMLQHGAYILLLKHYYRTRGPLEANAKQMLFICRANTPEEIEAVNSVLSKFFVLRHGFYHHDRCDEEIAKANEISEKRAKSGSKGGASKCQANAKQLLSKCDTSTSTSTKDNPPTPLGNPDQILQIARAYPKHDHLRDETEIPHAFATAIVDAVVKDGYETVLGGTKGYSAQLDNPKFAMRREEFFTGFHYRRYAPKPKQVKKEGEIPDYLKELWDSAELPIEKQREMYAEILRKSRPN